MLCKKTEFKLEKLVREYNCLQKPCINCTFKFMQSPEKMIFHASTYIVRLQVLNWYVNTRLQRIINRFC